MRKLVVDTVYSSWSKHEQLHCFEEISTLLYTVPLILLLPLAYKANATTLVPDSRLNHDGDVV